MSDYHNVRAYVPLRKKRARDNDVLSYSAAGSSSAALANHETTSNDDSDAHQEAEWTRLEHGISIVSAASDASVGTSACTSSNNTSDVPAAVDTFAQMHLPSDVLRALEQRGLAQPTAIQMQAIPAVLSGRDVIGLAATGSGKTLCYLLPLLTLLARRPYDPSSSSFSSSSYAASQQQQHPSSTAAAASPRGLVVVPTRELMEQILHELRHFATSNPNSATPNDWLVFGDTFTALGVCGGIPLALHEAQIRHAQTHAISINVLIATPGRLLHLLTRQCVVLHRIEYFVLDEVDRMLDNALEPQVRALLHALDATPMNRQTLLWSATLPHFLDRLARSAVVHPLTVRVGMGDAHTGRTRLEVLQHVVVVRSSREKRVRLLEALRATATPPVLVFCNARASVDAVTQLLQREQFHVASLHGDLPQAYRFEIVAAFRAGYVDVLVATDVAARGLDFPDVTHVVVFDMPLSLATYVHRCGRTGRRQLNGATTTGRVTAIVTPMCSIVTELIALLRETKQHVPQELAMLVGRDGRQG